MTNEARIAALMEELAHDQREPDELEAIEVEARKLCAAVDKFAEAMKEKLLTKAAHTWHGWDKLAGYWLRQCETRLMAHADELVRLGGGGEREVDIANFAMFHWYVHGRMENDSRQTVMEPRGEQMACSNCGHDRSDGQVYREQRPCGLLVHTKCGQCGADFDARGIRPGMPASEIERELRAQTKRRTG